jgi:hypothetical protein
VDGKLAVGDTLRLMELATQDTPEQMEQGFTSFSQCSSISKDPIFFIHEYTCILRNSNKMQLPTMNVQLPPRPMTAVLKKCLI